jgi:DnaJ-class molecular chaperone
VARIKEPGYVELELSEREAAQGGMVRVSMRVDLRCPKCGGGGGSVRCRRCAGTGLVGELVSAWLAVRPGATEGEVLSPPVALPGRAEGVRFRVRVARKG